MPTGVSLGFGRVKECQPAELVDGSWAPYRYYRVIPMNGMVVMGVLFFITLGCSRLLPVQVALGYQAWLDNHQNSRHGQRCGINTQRV